MKGTQREAIKLLSSLCNTGNMVNILANYVKHVHNNAYNPRKKMESQVCNRTHSFQRNVLTLSLYFINNLTGFIILHIHVIVL